jgi:catechol 2,3-dioxygenase-like lactoylglutathione lyase family enzyme
MRTLHLALAVSNIEQSVADYSARLGVLPVVVISGEYALWRTATLNLSIRKTSEPPGTMRHLGWEDAEASEFSTETDCNGITWEKFAAIDQAQEINAIWPNANYKPS